jgi:hypothetical protein
MVCSVVRIQTIVQQRLSDDLPTVVLSYLLEPGFQFGSKFRVSQDSQQSLGHTPLCQNK